MAIPNTLSNGSVINATPLNENFTFVNMPIGSIISWAKTFFTKDSGTTTSTTANKLVQTGQNFLTTVAVGNLVHNTTDTTFAYVTNVDSDTTLSLSSDIMTTSEAYTIYATPALESNWVECNGQTLSDANSIYNGATIPNLNGSLGAGLKGYFLRGHSSSGSTETSQNLAHTHNTVVWGNNSTGTSRAMGSSSSSGGSGNSATTSDGGDEARPSNYSVVFIMKVK